MEHDEGRKQRQQEEMAACDTHKVSQSRLLELSDLCTQFGMKDYLKEKKPMNNHQLVEQFTRGIDKSYLAYKENASMDRALLKCNLKERKPTKAE